MSADLHFGFSLALTLGVPLALAVRELMALRRDRGEGPERPPEPPKPLRPLPDCLIPKRLPDPAPERELELA